MIDIIHHKIYFKIAKQKLELALSCEKSVRSWIIDRNRNEWVKQDSIDHAYYEFLENAITSIIFSGLTVESFINYYGTTRLSKNKFNTYLDKLDLLSKWIVVPKFITGQEISTDSQALELLKKLVSSRNKLIHYKSSQTDPREFYNNFKTFEPTDSNNRLPWVKDAEIGVKAIYELFNEIRKIDTSITKEEIEWSEESNHWFELFSII
ncbi:hypothetical protein [Anabaena azotica]|uniref:hypothetical protein n=1 Tax=Anabaena azotica TaxID=197653 RepID=UPI0039A428E0